MFVCRCLKYKKRSRCGKNNEEEEEGDKDGEVEGIVPKMEIDNSFIVNCYVEKKRDNDKLRLFRI